MTGTRILCGGGRSGTTDQAPEPEPREKTGETPRPGRTATEQSGDGGPRKRSHRVPERLRLRVWRRAGPASPHPSRHWWTRRAGRQRRWPAKGRRERSLALARYPWRARARGVRLPRPSCLFAITDAWSLLHRLYSRFFSRRSVSRRGSRVRTAAPVR